MTNVQVCLAVLVGDPLFQKHGMKIVRLEPENAADLLSMMGVGYQKATLLYVMASQTAHPLIC